MINPMRVCALTCDGRARDPRRCHTLRMADEWCREGCEAGREWQRAAVRACPIGRERRLRECTCVSRIGVLSGWRDVDACKIHASDCDPAWRLLGRLQPRGGSRVSTRICASTPQLATALASRQRKVVVAALQSGAVFGLAAPEAGRMADGATLRAVPLLTANVRDEE
jgi:hypothetical protein